MKVLKYIVIVFVPSTFFLVSSHYQRKAYYESSMDWKNLCYEHTSGMQPDLCSHIGYSVDNAYMWASDFYQPTIIMLLVIITVFGFRLIQIGQELKELRAISNA